MTYSERMTGEEIDLNATYRCGECDAKMCRKFDGRDHDGCLNDTCEASCTACFPTLPKLGWAPDAIAQPGFFSRMIATVDRVLAKAGM